MNEYKDKRKHAVIVGGGITGLSTAWYLQNASPSSPAVTLIESSSFLGGKMVTRRLESEDGEFVIDAGPESFVTRKPEAWELALELGLENQIVNPGSETRNMYVLDGGIPKKIPLSPPAFITSDLLSMRGKLRMLLEPFIPARRDDEDESLADFVSRRLGTEALEKMIGPVLAGIYNTDPATQSIMTTSPIMREMEKDYGGLFKGALGRMRARKKDPPTGKPRPQFMTFDKGAQVMVDALEAQLTTQIMLNTRVHTISQEGDDYILHLNNGETMVCDAVILTVPANEAQSLLANLYPDTANLLGNIEHKNIGTVTLIYKGLDLGYQINGLMIPRRENRRIDAVTWTTNKPMKRGPDGYDMLRVFFGGGDPTVVELPEEEIVAVIRTELEDILGITAEPIQTKVFCWPESFPQAAVGHQQFVDKINTQLPPGVWAAGSSYRGIGIPDCIRQGRDVAEAVIKYYQE